jgi:hypothetical protein
VTPDAFDSDLGGEKDAFLQVYGPAGNLLYSTYFGGAKNEFSRWATATPSGRAVMGGTTASPDLSTTPGAFRTVRPGRGFQAFIAAFDLALSGGKVKQRRESRL